MTMNLIDTFLSCGRRTTSPYEAMRYVAGERPPNHPLPSVVGKVYQGWDGVIFETIICDADDRFNPRLWVGVSAYSGVVYDDSFMHDSPNRR